MGLSFHLRGGFIHIVLVVAPILLVVSRVSRHGARL
ncbi:MAG TPA: DUF5670 family protein [Candidatus Dormibacteraeota bacterium]|nr:DUF5670 family protein [Candidatus Dormibacteraeota bacterium]